MKIDFNMTGSDLIISTPCKITVAENKVHNLTGNLCLRSKKNITFKAFNELAARDVQFVTDERVTIKNNAKFNVQDMTLESLGQTENSRVHIRHTSEINAKNLTLKAHQRATLGHTSRYNVGEKLSMSASGEEFVAFWKNTEITAKEVEIDTSSKLRLTKDVSITADKVVMNCVECKFSKKAKIEAIQKIGPMFNGMKPRAKIEADSFEGRAPLKLSFSGENSWDNNEIVSFTWLVGNTVIQEGSTKIFEYEFKEAGTYKVKLKVTDNEGLAHTKTQKITVHESSNLLPVAGEIGHDIRETGEKIKVSLYTFDHGDEDGEIVKYIWDYGNGESQELTAQESYDEGWHYYDYSVAGNYTVSLTLVDDMGGRTTYSKEIPVVNTKMPVVNLNVDKLTGRAPLTVTFDVSGATDEDGSIEYIQYKFGNGDKKTSYDGENKYAYTFSEPGTYEARVIVRDNDRATTDQYITIVVTDSDPNYSFNENYLWYNIQVAGYPTVVEFESEEEPFSHGAEITKVKYDFGDGTKVELPYVQDRELGYYSHSYKEPGFYVVKQVYVDSLGRESLPNVSNIDVRNPSVPIPKYSVSTFSGAAPLTVTFNAEASVDLHGEISSYKWRFYDGGDDVKGEGVHEVTRTFTKNGVYNVRLQVYDNEGAQKRVYIPIYVGVNPPETGIPPVPRIISNYRLVDAPYAVQFQGDESFDPDSPNGGLSYEWNFGDYGSVDNFSNEPKPVHNYNLQGTYFVSLRVTDEQGNSAEDFTIVYVNENVVNDPHFDVFKMEDENTYEFNADGNFQNGLFDLNSLVWSMGDGTYYYGESLINHTYSNEGSYVVSMKIKRVNGDYEEVFRTVDTQIEIPSTPEFDIEGDLFANNQIKFRIKDTVPDISSYSYRWSFFDGTVYEGSYSDMKEIFHSFSESGNGDVSLTILLPNGTSVVETKYVEILDKDNGGNTQIHDIACVYRGDLQYVCVVYFDSDNPIVRYDWIINNVAKSGGGTVWTSNILKDQSNELSIALVDNLGNVTNFTKELFFVNEPPVAKFNCEEKELNSLHCNAIESYDPDGVVKSYSWKLGDEEYSGEEVEFSNITNEEVEVLLSVSDNNGGVNTISKMFSIELKPVPVISVDSDNIKTGSPINFDASESYDLKGFEIVKYTWDFGDGSSQKEGENVVHSFSSPGFPVITLIIENELGVTSIVNKTLRVTRGANPNNKPPVSDFEIGTIYTLGENISLDARHSYDDDNIIEYHWEVSSGEVFFGESASYTASEEGEFTLTLTVTDEYGVSSKMTRNFEVLSEESYQQKYFSQANVYIADILKNEYNPVNDIILRIEGGEYNLSEGIFIYVNDLLVKPEQIIETSNAEIVISKELLIDGVNNIELSALDNDGKKIVMSESVLIGLRSIILNFSQEISGSLKVISEDGVEFTRAIDSDQLNIPSISNSKFYITYFNGSEFSIINGDETSLSFYGQVTPLPIESSAENIDFNKGLENWKIYGGSGSVNTIDNNNVGVLQSSSELMTVIKKVQKSEGFIQPQVQVNTLSKETSIYLGLASENGDLEIVKFDNDNLVKGDDGVYRSNFEKITFNSSADNDGYYILLMFDESNEEVTKAFGKESIFDFLIKNSIANNQLPQNSIATTSPVNVDVSFDTMTLVDSDQSSLEMIGVSVFSDKKFKVKMKKPKNLLKILENISNVYIEVNPIGTNLTPLRFDLYENAHDIVSEQIDNNYFVGDLFYINESYHENVTHFNSAARIGKDLYSTITLHYTVAEGSDEVPKKHEFYVKDTSLHKLWGVNEWLIKDKASLIQKVKNYKYLYPVFLRMTHLYGHLSLKDGIEYSLNSDKIDEFINSDSAYDASRVATPLFGNYLINQPKITSISNLDGRTERISRGSHQWGFDIDINFKEYKEVFMADNLNTKTLKDKARFVMNEMFNIVNNSSVDQIYWGFEGDKSEEEKFVKRMIDYKCTDDGRLGRILFRKAKGHHNHVHIRLKNNSYLKEGQFKTYDEAHVPEVPKRPNIMIKKKGSTVYIKDSNDVAKQYFLEVYDTAGNLLLVGDSKNFNGDYLFKFDVRESGNIGDISDLEIDKSEIEIKHANGNSEHRFVIKLVPYNGEVKNYASCNTEEKVVVFNDYDYCNGEKYGFHDSFGNSFITENVKINGQKVGDFQHYSDFQEQLSKNEIYIRHASLCGDVDFGSSSDISIGVSKVKKENITYHRDINSKLTFTGEKIIFTPYLSKGEVILENYSNDRHLQVTGGTIGSNDEDENTFIRRGDRGSYNFNSNEKDYIPTALMGINYFSNSILSSSDKTLSTSIEELIVKDSRLSYKGISFKSTLENSSVTGKVDNANINSSHIEGDVSHAKVLNVSYDHAILGTSKRKKDISDYNEGHLIPEHITLFKNISGSFNLADLTGTEYENVEFEIKSACSIPNVRKGVLTKCLCEKVNNKLVNTCGGN